LLSAAALIEQNVLSTVVENILIRSMEDGNLFQVRELATSNDLSTSRVLGRAMSNGNAADERRAETTISVRHS